MGEGISDSEFKALISLLDDPDEEVLFHVSRRLKDLGIHGVEKLEIAWEHAGDELTQDRIEDLIQEIQLSRLLEEIQRWRDNDSDDLLLGAILLAKFRYPELDESILISAIDALKDSIWLELNNDLTPLEEIHVFNNVFYKLTGFIGDNEDLTNPDLGFINKVLELKKGNSHALGVLYLSLCQRLHIPVYGVPLPFFFVLAYVDDDHINQLTTKDIAFYINPVHEGTIFQKKQISEYLKKVDVSQNKRYFLPVDNVTVIASLAEYLCQCFEKRGEDSQAIAMRSIFDLLVGE